MPRWSTRARGVLSADGRAGTLAGVTPNTFAWFKGHGTENDFVLLPDHDGSVHGTLEPTLVARLCHRRRGIGADGVMRVVRSAALDIDPALAGDSEWFMDYRNADGSLSEMCGNGIRLFALHLLQEGLAEAPMVIGTRAGPKTVTVDSAGALCVDMGVPRLLGETKIDVGDHTWAAQHVDMGNPHAVAFVDDLAQAGPLTVAPTYDRAVYPGGVNIEFCVRRGDRHVAMRVHERGSGETRSCGTGACAVAVACALADGVAPSSGSSRGPETYRVDLPGGTLRVTWAGDGHVLMAGPAEIVAGGQLQWHVPAGSP